jgi:hypothetical protein
VGSETIQWKDADEGEFYANSLFSVHVQTAHIIRSLRFLSRPYLYTTLEIIVNSFTSPLKIAFLKSPKQGPFCLDLLALADLVTSKVYPKRIPSIPSLLLSLSPIS